LLLLLLHLLPLKLLERVLAHLLLLLMVQVGFVRSLLLLHVLLELLLRLLLLHRGRLGFGVLRRRRGSAHFQHYFLAVGPHEVEHEPRQVVRRAAAAAVVTLPATTAARVAR